MCVESIVFNNSQFINNNTFLVLWCNICNFSFNANQVECIELITGMKCPKYRQAMDCSRHLIGQLLAEYGASHYYANYLQTPSIPIIHQERGKKPTFESEFGIDFNISHSNNIVICAFSHKSIGADVEYVEQDISSIAERFFKEGEKHIIVNSLNPNETAYKIWVRKESYLKMLGKGIAYINDMPSVVNEAGFVNDLNKYRFHDIVIQPGYQVSVCTDSAVNISIVQEVNLRCLISLLEKI